MRFWHWLGRTHTPAPSYRPGIDVLEDRTVPAAFRTFAPAPVLPATHLQVLAPQVVEAGQAFAVTVEALNAKNQVVSGFTGTVQLTLATLDSGASLPRSFTFSAADHGEYTFQAKLAATGNQTLEASSGALSGQACLSVEPVNVQVYVPAYNIGYTVVYPFGVVPYPVVTLVLMAPNVIVSTPSSAAANTGGLASTNPIDNISYGQNPFGTGVVNNTFGIVIPPAVPSVSRL
jgi:hypothetical protein